jgi:CubicO group peptidase (beta-lactamase class C family)
MDEHRSLRERVTRFATCLAAIVAALLPVAAAAQVDLDLFEQNIRSKFEGKTTGYAYAIYQNGSHVRSGAGGWAIVPNSEWFGTTGYPMTPDKRGELFSMSKTITAAALMRTLEIMQARGENVTIGSPIGAYLPPDWVRGPGVATITFRAVLRHEAGLTSSSSDKTRYADVRETIARGVEPTLSGLRSYCNCNYALLRVLIPRMLSLGYLSNLVAWYGNEEDGTAQAFVNIVKLQLLYPAGITADVVFSGPTPYTRYYNFADKTKYTLFEMYQPRRRWAGGGFFYMSVKEFAYFLARLRLGQGVSPSSWQLMVDHELGLYAVPSAGFLNHSGAMTVNDMGGRSGWVMFPDGITVVAFHNSTGPVGDDPDPAAVPAILIDAYSETIPPAGPPLPGGISLP